MIEFKKIDISAGNDAVFNMIESVPVSQNSAF